MSVMRVKIKLQPQIIRQFILFLQKSKQALKNQPNETLPEVGFLGFFNFLSFNIFETILYQLY